MKKLIISVMIIFIITACSSTGGKGTNSINVGVGFSGL